MKIKKMALLIIMGILALCLLGTAQAIIFNNSPIIKLREDYNGGTLYCLDKGLLVDYYLYADGKKGTVFKWEQRPTHGITFPAYDEDNTENKSHLDRVNHTPKFQVHAEFPVGWTVKEPISGWRDHCSRRILYPPYPLRTGSAHWLHRF